MQWKRLFGRRPQDTEIHEEIESHLRMAIADRIDRGESPQQARTSATREFGSAAVAREDTRAVWISAAIERLGQDLKYAARQMRRSPGFTAIAVLTLAFGLSVNITIFSVISSLFLRPLPVANGERLVVVMQQKANTEFPQALSWSDFQDYRAGIAEFSDMLAISFRPAHLSFAGHTADRTWIEAVSGNYFSMLGIEPWTGRLFQPGEGEKRGADPVAVLGYHYWQTRLGADPGIVGRTVVINGRAFTIIGITPEGFSSAQWAMAPAAFIPATMIPEIFPGTESILEKRDSAAFKVMAHLRPGASVAQAASAVQVVAQRLAREYRPNDPGTQAIVRPEMLTRPEPSVSGFMPFAAAVFTVMAGLVLFIACANVANLMFSRALARQKEIGIRSAIGAPRRRLIRQLLTESVAVAALAGAVGMLLTAVTTPLLSSLSTQNGDVPVHPDKSWDWQPLLYTIVISIAAGVATGLAPALRATKVDAYTILKGGASGAGRKRHLFRSALVLAQVAVCVVVLVCGGLFVRSLQQLAVFDLGFRPDRLLMASVDLGLQGYEPHRSRLFLDRLTERVQALPGVESAAIASSVPFDTYFDTRGVVAADIPAGHDPAKHNDELQAGVNRVYPGYFETLGVTLLSGRQFNKQDRDSAPRVAVVNQTLADRLWPGQQPLGKRFRWKSAGDPIEVVGVVSNGKYLLLGEAPRAYVYLPFAQDYETLVTLHVRSEAADAVALAPALGRVLRSLDPDLPVFNVRTMDEHLRSSAFAFFPLRMGALLAAAQGLVALLLAMIGIYGVVGYSVRQQRHDIGIRIALGARRLDVLRLVSRAGLRPTLIGLALGLAASFGLARLLAALLYGLNPLSLPVFSAVVALVLSVSLLACWLPARRAARLDPIEALRQQ
jgi:predicted permease